MALLVAVVMVVANLFEPLTVDDVCHHYYAEQVARDPLHPFEFTTVWHQRPVAAWTVMVAPVNSYYWAPGLLLCDALLPPEWQTVGWHLWYLPVYFLFCRSLLALLRRWVKRGSGTMLCAIALGGAVLPGLNLLLEVPMLSLGLAGLVVVLRAMDRRSVPLALCAGALWGLAFQTKYSAMAFFAPWFLQALLRWRWREFVIGGVTAAAVALGIEGLVSLSHGGGSYFLEQLQLSQIRSWSQLIRGMFVQVGGLGAPAALLGLLGLGAPRWVFRAALAIYGGGLLTVAMLTDPERRSLAEGAPDSIAYLLMALLTWSVLLAVFAVLLRGGLGGLRGLRVVGTRRIRLFLVCWFVAEVASSFVVSPFPAARRVLMVVVAATVAAGWLAVRRVGVNGAVRGVAVGSVALGLLLQAIDYLEGYAWVQAARDTRTWWSEHAPEHKLYYTGGWGFEFYAPRAGLPPFLRGETVLEPGDLIAVGSIDGSENPWFEWSDKLEEVTTLSCGTDGFPLSTQFCYYSGRRPVDHQYGPRFVVWIVRATERLPSSDLVVRPDQWHTPSQVREMNRR
ncbi:MAG: hypothetical protein H6835_11675 [Planctomycetes bacterium]|nr:hypothetical protein [Planctomycetota bacterium]